MQISSIPDTQVPICLRITDIMQYVTLHRHSANRGLANIGLLSAFAQHQQQTGNIERKLSTDNFELMLVPSKVHSQT